ncbi:MAG: hypothetical protein GDA41_05900, partial [Rhodospirillales bacterium]|nr:hypothetical protein [Rhodospirillales bacterium]
MSIDATACTLRVTTAATTAARARKEINLTAFSLMKASHCAQVAAEDILRGHIKGFLLRRFAKRTTGKDLLTYIPADWVEALRNGRAGLILDHSREGMSYIRSPMQTWHRQLKSCGIPPSRVVFITQNRNFQDGYNRWCEEQGVEARITIVNYDYFISQFCRRSWRDPAAALVKKIRYFENRTEIEKRFVCLNYIPRPFRIALLTRLIKDNYWDDGFISFGGFELGKRKRSHTHSREINRFRRHSLAASSEAYLEALAAKGRVLFGKAKTGGHPRWLTGDDMTNIYRCSAFTLVTETEMSPTAHRITEKSLKPLANCHPAILFANYRALALLKSFGFKTFEPWIDEGYDAIEDPEARFLAAYEAFRQFYKTAWDRLREDRELR